MHAVNLTKRPVGAPLKDKVKQAYEYSDCWVEDARLVVLNARDAAEHGARIMTRTKVISADRVQGHWQIVTETNGVQSTHTARALVNAGGLWVENVVRQVAHQNTSEGLRLVRGSHIVTKKLFDHD